MAARNPSCSPAEVDRREERPTVPLPLTSHRLRALSLTPAADVPCRGMDTTCSGRAAVGHGHVPRGVHRPVPPSTHTAQAAITERATATGAVGVLGGQHITTSAHDASDPEPQGDLRQEPTPAEAKAGLGCPTTPRGSARAAGAGTDDKYAQALGPASARDGELPRRLLEARPTRPRRVPRAGEAAGRCVAPGSREAQESKGRWWAGNGHPSLRLSDTSKASRCRWRRSQQARGGRQAPGDRRHGGSDGARLWRAWASGGWAQEPGSTARAASRGRAGQNPMNPRVGCGMQQAHGPHGGASRRGGEEPRGRNMR